MSSDRIRGYSDVSAMRKYGVIVRLRTNQKQIDAYRNAGNLKLVKELERKTAVINLRIMHALIRNWNFCPLYFIKNTNSSKVARDSILAVNLLSGSDTLIKTGSDTFFFMDYGAVMTNVPADEWNYRNINKTVEGSSVDVEEALVLKDAEGRQLTKPLPFFYNLSWSYFFSKMNKDHLDKLEGDIPVSRDQFDLPVQTWNDQLIRFYNRMMKRKGIDSPAPKEAYWQHKNSNKIYYSWIPVIEAKLDSLLAK
ncbi:MAG: hypothetical protein U0T73_12935 [Chitinophagales bacterium]